MDGIINILKPTGITSHDVVGYIRKNYKFKKVGHTGTLDPNAAGVLPVCIGKATKLSQYIMKKNKKYRCQMTFGAETDTLDSYGTVLNRHHTEYIEPERIKKALEEFTGDISQIPPAYSAIKINGQKLYEKARNNEVIEDIPSRVVSISEISIIDYSFPKLTLDISCSSGTYIRSLVRDIAHTLGTVAYMSLLIRTSSGEFKIEDAVTLEELGDVSSINGYIKEMGSIDLDMKDIIIKDTALVSFLNGVYVSQKGIISDLSDFTYENVRVLDTENRLLGIGIIKQKDSIDYLKSDSLLI